MDNLTQCKKKALGYVRISSQRQINNESPETQKKLIQQYADSNNIEIIEWFEDIAASGKNADRRELNNLLHFADKYKGTIDHVVVYKMIRASRDIESYILMVRSVLKAKGITMRSATEPIDDTKEGRFFELFHVLIGQLDNEGKAETTMHNMKSLAGQGYYQHPPIVGYLSHKVPNQTGKMRPTLKFSDMAPRVRDVLERFSEGDITKAELCRYAADIGLRSRCNKKLGKDSINRLIKNPTYAGYICDRFTDYQLVEGKHEGIISIDTYQVNQELLYGHRSQKGLSRAKINSEYPLKRLVKCTNCNNNLYASAPTTGSGGKSPRYHCSRKTCIGKVKSVKTSELHNNFEKLLNQLKPNDGILKLYRRILINEANKQMGQINKAIASCNDELEAIKNTKINAIEKLTQGLLTVEEKNILMESLDVRKAELSINLSQLNDQQKIRESDIDNAIKLMQTVDKQWGLSEIADKQRFQNILFPDGLVYDINSGRFGTNNISPLYRYIPTKKDLPETEKSFLVAHVHSNWNLLLSELHRWRKFTGAPHLLSTLDVRIRTGL